MARVETNVGDLVPCYFCDLCLDAPAVQSGLDCDGQSGMAHVLVVLSTNAKASLVSII